MLRAKRHIESITAIVIIIKIVIIIGIVNRDNFFVKLVRATRLNY